MERNDIVKVKSNIFKIIAVTLIALLVLYNYIDINPSAENNEYVSENTRIHFIDVGQGDCTLVESNGEYMLIDAGETGNEEKISNYLENMNITSLRYVIATHPHSDHIGSLAYIISNFDVDDIIMPKVSASTPTYKNFAKAVQQKNIKAIEPVVGDNYSFGDCSFTIIAPYTYDKKNMNNNSVCIKLVHGNDKVILTGDSEKAVEKKILKGNIDIDCDLYKAAHHGSSTSNSYNFVKAMSPQYAVISCGKNNDYGHPHIETVETFDKLGVTVYRTDESGDLVFESTGNGIKPKKGIISNTELTPAA